MDKVERLSLHIIEIAIHRTALPNQVARGILAKPQDHIDALVEAGVLMKVSVAGKNDVYVNGYQVTPEQYKWQVTAVDDDGVTLRKGPPPWEWRIVPPTLPIEVPE